MRRCLSLAICLLACLCAGAPAFAATIGFEGVVSGGGSSVPVTPYSEAGFTLTNSLGSASDGIFDEGAGLVNNGTDVFAWCGGCSGAPLVITLSENGGNPFSLLSFEAGNLVPGFFTAGEQIVVTGNLAGGGTVVQSLSLVADQLTLFTLGAGFTNLASVEFVGSLAPGGSHLAMDNLVVSLPEPATALLVAGGLMSLAVAGRRRETHGRPLPPS